MMSIHLMPMFNTWSWALLSWGCVLASALETYAFSPFLPVNTTAKNKIISKPMNPAVIPQKVPAKGSDALGYAKEQRCWQVIRPEKKKIV